MAISERDLKITISSIFDGGAFKAAGAAAKNLGEQVETTFERMEERAERTESVFKGLVEAFIGVEIVEALKKIAEGASDASDSLEIAANTAKNFGKSFSADEMEQWLQKLAKSAQGGGFAINELRSSTQALATTGASAAQIQRLLVDAVALAATKHIELAEATHLVVEAATGHVEVLGRYGIVVKDAADRTLTFAQVMANLEAETMGNAEKRAESLEGAFGRLATAANDLVTGPFGQTMEHIFIAGANAATALLSAIAALPAPVLDVAAAGVALIGGLTALGVMLPATKLAFEFMADGVLIAFDALTGLKDVLIALPGLAVAAARAMMSIVEVLRAIDILAAPAEIIEAVIVAITVAIVGGLGALVEYTRKWQDLKNLWSWFKDGPIGQALFPKIPELKIPKTPLTGLGGADPNAQKGIDDWLETRKAAIMRAVEIAAQATAEAQARLDDTTSRLQELRDKRDPTKPLTQGNVAEEQRLANQQLQQERDLRTAIATQRTADLDSQRELNALAASLPANDKDRATHAVALREEAEKQVTAAIRLDETYNKIGGTLAKMAQGMREITLEIARQAAAAAQLAAQRATTDRNFGIGSAEEYARTRYELGTITPDVDRNARVNQAQYGLSEAQANRDRAKGDSQDAVDEINRITDQIADGLLTYKEGQDALAAANEKLAASVLAVDKAMDDVTIAAKRLKEAKAEERAAGLKAIEQKTLGQIPGVGVGATGNLSFSPASFLADAISQSHLFANVMELVNEIMFTFTQIINAFQPVVDALLTVVAYVVNGFISLWNVIAKLVSILGIQLQQLSYINTVFTATGTNLVTFTHDIPTLNELATGNVAPLTTTPSNNPWSILHQDLVTNDLHQQNWFSSVINALGALLLIDWLTHGKFLTSIQGLLPQFGSFFSGIGTAFENGWNGLQSWLTAHLGNVGAGIADIVGGTALLFTNDKGVLGVLEKVLGVLLIIQGLMNVSGGGGSIINTIANALGLGGGNNPIGYQNGVPVFNGGTVNVPVDTTGLTDPGSGIGIDPNAYLTQTPITGTTPDIGSLLGGAGGSGGDVVFDPGTGGYTLIGSTGTAVPDGPDMGNSSFGSWGNSPTGGSALGNLGLNLGAGIGGNLIGGWLNSMLGGNSQNGQIGGTILGAVGSIFGPLGTGLGSLVGNLIGGLFGPHYNQQNNPDMYANDGYAQAEANYQGSSNTQANGYVQEDSTLSSALGGMSESQFLSKFIASNPQLAAQLLTPTEISEFSGNDAVESLHQGTLTLGNGQSANWSVLFNHVNDAMTKITNYVQSATNNNTTSTASTTNQPITITNQVSIGSVDGYNDIEQLGTDLANVQIRTIQSRLYLSGRATAVA